MTSTVKLNEEDLRDAVRFWLKSQGIDAESVNLGMDTEDHTTAQIFYAEAHILPKTKEAS